MPVITVPRTYGGTLLITYTPGSVDTLTSGPVVTLLADQLVNVAGVTSAACANAPTQYVPRFLGGTLLIFASVPLHAALSQLNDSQVATVLLSEKVV